MSWPSDGEPRFVVREHGGYRQPLYGGGGGVPGVSVRVVDRGYCHRTVREWASEDMPATSTYSRRLLARSAAERLAAQLNERGTT